jgi:hypothetical protein
MFFRYIAVFAMAGLGSCAASQPADPPPRTEGLAGLLADRTALALVLGLEDDSTQAFSRVVDATFSRDGRHIIVLNRHAPFVRVFRRDGSLRAMFVGEGDGPGESRLPYAVAPGRNDQILVVDGGLKLLTLDGNLLAERRHLPIQVVEVLKGCDDEWLVYGPSPLTSTKASSRAWIHRLWLRPPDVVRVEPIYWDSTSSLTVGFGAQQTLVQADSSFILLHRYSTTPALLKWNCADLSPKPMTEGRQLLRPKRELRPLTLDLSEPFPGGIAIADAGLLWLETVTLLPSGSTNPEQAWSETWFTLLTPDSLFRAAVAGNYRIRDTWHDEEVVLTRSDPFETVVIVRLSDVLQRVREGSASRRKT